MNTLFTNQARVVSVEIELIAADLPATVSELLRAQVARLDLGNTTAREPRSVPLYLARSGTTDPAILSTQRKEYSTHIEQELFGCEAVEF